MISISFKREKDLEKQNENYLKELNGTAFSNATKPHMGKESDVHKQLKWFVVKHLTKKLIKEGNLECRNEKDPLANEINKKIINNNKLNSYTTLRCSIFN